MPRELGAPVEFLPTDRREADKGIAICLSGGGYRAMLFHLGALWRLAELGYLSSQAQGDRGTLERVSSVSGGSITSAVLGWKWQSLNVDEASVVNRFITEVVEPVRELAGKTLIGLGSGVLAMILPGSINDWVAEGYCKRLYGNATLQDLPDRPRFVINATNLQSGVLWRFSKPYMWDWRVGKIERPTVSLARAVAASSAFPPFLSPARFKFRDSDYTPNSGKGLQQPPFTTNPVLSDGGVYDNLGLETAWKRYKTLLVSDAGGQMECRGKIANDWVRQSYRVLNVIDNQVRSLRKRNLIASYLNGERAGAFWSIRGDIADYHVPNALPCPHDKTIKLAEVKTDLAKKAPVLQERLINWGYAICDAGMRRYVDSSLPPPSGFPYPSAGIG